MPRATPTPTPMLVARGMPVDAGVEVVVDKLDVVEFDSAVVDWAELYVVVGSGVVVVVEVASVGIEVVASTRVVSAEVVCAVERPESVPSVKMIVDRLNRTTAVFTTVAVTNVVVSSSVVDAERKGVTERAMVATRPRNTDLRGISNNERLGVKSQRNSEWRAKKRIVKTMVLNGSVLS